MVHVQRREQLAVRFMKRKIVTILGSTALTISACGDPSAIDVERGSSAAKSAPVEQEQTATSSPTNGTALAVGSEVTSERLLEGESAYRRVMESQQGTAQQLRDVAYLDYATNQLASQSCMSSAGFDYTIPPMEAEYAGWVQTPMPLEHVALMPLDGNTLPGGPWAAAERMYMSAVSVQRANASINPGFTELSADDKNEYVVALQTCVDAIDASARPSDPSLDVAIHEFLRSIEEDKIVSSSVAQYPQCMEDFGFEVGDPAELYSLLDTEYQRQYSEQFARDPGIELESMIFDRQMIADADAADADCRREAHGLAIGLLVERLPDFLAEHDEALSDLSTAWQAVSEEAAALETQSSLPRCCE